MKLSDAALCAAACMMSVVSSWASVLQEGWHFSSSFSFALLTGQVFSKCMSFSGGVAHLC